MNKITIRPCLLGWSVDDVYIQMSGRGVGTSVLYSTFGEVLWYLLNKPCEFTLEVV